MTSRINTATLAVIVGRRWDLVQSQVLPNAKDQGFDEILIVGSGVEPGEGYRAIPVPPITATTLDGLIYRDVAASVTDADVLVYLSDDHALHHHFGQALRYWMGLDTWDVLIPRRYTEREGRLIPLNMGAQEYYCAGHGMVVKRKYLQRVPWLTAPHHPNWDVFHSRMLMDAGARMVPITGGDLAIQDIEPGATPWL